MTAAALYPDLNPRLLAMAGKMLEGRPEDAEDAVMAVWERMLTRQPVFTCMEKAYRWAYIVLHNVIIDLYRRARPVSQIMETDAVAADHYPSVEHAEWFSLVDRLTAKEQRLCAALALGYSVTEGAIILSMKPNAYRVATCRLRAKLRV